MNLIDDGEIYIYRHFILADAFQLVRLRLRLVAGFEHFRKNGSDRIGANDANLRVLLFEVMRNTGDGATGSNADHHVRNLALRLVPDLRPPRLVMALGIRWVGVMF